MPREVFNEKWVQYLTIDDILMLMFVPIQTYTNEGVTVKYKMDGDHVFIYAIEQEGE